MTTVIHKRVEAARAGTNPTVVARVESGWVVLGDVQFLRGYSLLLSDPVVPDLNSLPDDQRTQFLQDMAHLGDALLEVTGAYRINYEILGNSEAALHAHLFPRYMTEPDEFRTHPAWSYDQEYRLSIAFDADRDKDLMRRIAESMNRYR